jgi:hypothetical protein
MVLEPGFQDTPDLLEITLVSDPYLPPPRLQESKTLYEQGQVEEILALHSSPDDAGDKVVGSGTLENIIDEIFEELWPETLDQAQDLMERLSKSSYWNEEELLTGTPSLTDDSLTSTPRQPVKSGQKNIIIGSGSSRKSSPGKKPLTSIAPPVKPVMMMMAIGESISSHGTNITATATAAVANTRTTIQRRTMSA